MDRDLDLSFRGRVAESWQILEEAYLFADETLRLPDGAAATPAALLARLRTAQAAGAPALRTVETMTVEPAETRTVQIAPSAPGPPPGRPRAAGPPADTRLDPAPAAHQVRPARRRPGLLREPRPPSGRVHGPARPPAIRRGAGPRDGPRRGRGARPADRGESGHRLPAAAGRALPRRTRAHREGRALHVRDPHGSPEPLAPGARLRAGEGGGDPGPLHGAGHVQGALPARLRELEHGHPARAPAESRGAGGRGPRCRQGPRGLQCAGLRVQSAAGRQRAVPLRRVGERRLDPARTKRGLLGGAPELPRVLHADPSRRPDVGARLLCRRRPTAMAPRPTRWRASRTTPASTSRRCWAWGTATSATTSAARSSRTSGCGPPSAWRSTSMRSSATSSTGRGGGRRDPIPSRRRTTTRTSRPCPTTQRAPRGF